MKRRDSKSDLLILEFDLFFRGGSGANTRTILLQPSSVSVRF